ncbi:ADP-ribosylglycohydrolase family protein [Thermomicrobiaceae bacterium CFH 74404]|uniref:ADP-ribosylglycohydrolase family protein n=1 Tax=Thermalbibacter longus TaxID=2951981 RepID=A0AA41WDC1_9BACT|nr:ADP-ribosylglycohydrolase family protein [Thermalbibacter longus]MCM8748419.1 ADP-ribosylglycohydrolase family protein [Thermalbibacter longus]
MDAVSERVARDRFRGCLAGLAVGDALGATVELCSASEIRARFGVHREIIGGGWLSLAPGEVTDDTEMALCIARSIVELGRVEPGDIARRFVEWFLRGPKDVGTTVARVLSRIAAGERWEEAAERVYRAAPYRAAGNGSLMRTAPVALFHAWRPRELVQASLEVSRITHAHPEAMWACVALGQAIATAIQANAAPAEALLAAAAAVPEPAVRRAVEDAPALDPETAATSGYVLNTLRIALWAVSCHGSFEDAVVAAVNLGGDADTAGAVTGALAGARAGITGIPQRWLGVLRGRAELVALADRLLDLARSPEPGSEGA